MLELPPGKYQYSLKLAGRPAGSNSVEVTAGRCLGFDDRPRRRSIVAADLLIRHLADAAADCAVTRNRTGRDHAFPRSGLAGSKSRSSGGRTNARIMLFKARRIGL